MSGLPIDINTSATSADSTASRPNRSRRDGDLRHQQFEQLLLALTSKAKQLPRGTSDASTSQSTTKTSSSDHSSGPAANPTRYAARSDSSTAVSQDDSNEVTTDVDESTDEETKPDDETSLSGQDTNQADPSGRLIVCSFDHRAANNTALPKSDEEPAQDGLARGVEGERKHPVAKPASNVPSVTQSATDAPAPTAVDAQPATAAKTDHSGELSETPTDLTVVATDRVRKVNRSRPAKAVTDEQSTKTESAGLQTTDVTAATSGDSAQKAASRGDKVKLSPSNDVQQTAESKPELAAIARTQAVNQVAEDRPQSQASQEPTAKEGLKESRTATPDDAPTALASPNAAVTAPPPVAAPTLVAPPVTVPPPQQQAAPATSNTGTTSSKTDGTGGVTNSPTNRLPQRAIATTRPSGPVGSSQIDTVKFIQRIARAMQTAREAGGEIRLRLSPPELGSMKMEVKVQDGTLVAKVETETAQAQSTLVDNLPALKERLAEQGVRIERFDVDVSRDGSGQSGFTDRDSGSEHGSQQRMERREAFHRQVSDPVELGAISSPITTPQSINVVA